jgi:hypothetical protein
MISPAGQFQYVAIVPESAGEEGSGWPVQRRRPEIHDGPCLLGPSPTLTITDADPVSSPGIPCPGVRRSRFTLTAPARAGETIRSAWFHLDRDLGRAFEPGDALHMTRTGCGGIGISLLRGINLVFAVGAVTAVPLGESLKVRVPLDLVGEAVEIFRKRDPEFEFREQPVEVRFAGNTHILYRGTLEFSSYHVWVEHGRYPGLPGTDVCLAITLNGAARPFAANASAQLLTYTPFEMERRE